MTTRNTRVRGDAVAPIEGVTVEGSDYSPGTGSNLLLYSEELDNAAWVIQTPTVFVVDTDLLAEPLTSTTTGDSFTRTVGSNFKDGGIQQEFPVVSGTTYCFSVYYHYLDLYYAIRGLQMSLDNTYFAANTFTNFALPQDTTTPSVSATDNANGAVEDVGSGWYRISIYATATDTGNANVDMRIVTNAATDGYRSTWYARAGYGYYAWGMQVNEGTEPGDYTKTTNVRIT